MKNNNLGNEHTQARKRVASFMLQLSVAQCLLLYVRQLKTNKMREHKKSWRQNLNLETLPPLDKAVRFESYPYKYVNDY